MGTTDPDGFLNLGNNIPGVNKRRHAASVYLPVGISWKDSDNVYIKKEYNYIDFSSWVATNN